MKKKVLMSVDVEDWFQVETMREKFPLKSWKFQSYRVENNINRILDLFDQSDTKATFFCLGGLAKKFPDMIRLIHSEGHEIASHGSSHQMLNELSDKQVRIELFESKAVLENIIGDQVFGFRAPTFSIRDSIYPLLKEAEYTYDSSLNLFKHHDKYGSVDMKNFREISPGFLEHKLGIKVLTIPTLKSLGLEIPWGGGGYFRLIPYYLYKKGVQHYLGKDDFFMFYMHPWEIDQSQPRVKGLSMGSYFRHYNGLNRTYGNLKSFLKDFHCTSIADSGIVKE